MSRTNHGNNVKNFFKGAAAVAGATVFVAGSAAILVAAALVVAPAAVAALGLVGGIAVVAAGTVLALTALTATYSVFNPSPNFMAREEIKEGDSYFDKQQYSQAIEQYTKAIERDPKKGLATHARYNRGLAYMQKREYAKAASDFLAAYENDHKKATWNNYQQAKQAAEAVKKKAVTNVKKTTPMSIEMELLGNVDDLPSAPTLEELGDLDLPPSYEEHIRMSTFHQTTQALDESYLDLEAREQHQRRNEPLQSYSNTSSAPLFDYDDEADEAEDERVDALQALVNASPAVPKEPVGFFSSPFTWFKKQVSSSTGSENNKKQARVLAK